MLNFGLNMIFFYRKALCSGSSATPSAKHHKFSESAEVYYANWDQLELIWPLDERPEGILNIWIYNVPLRAFFRSG